MSAAADHGTGASPPHVRRARLTLIAIFAVCAAPIVLGTLAFYFWQPSGRTNYGELLPPTPVRFAGTTPEGTAFDPRVLEGKWVMVMVDRGTCDAKCEEKLFFSRQVRTAQGRDQDRVTRLWITDVSPSEKAAPLLAGAHVLRPGEGTVLGVFGAQPERHVFLVDPMSNLMLRFPQDADPKRMIKDLQKLLKVNNRQN